jgi:uncharacterized protein YyaL (SSP411 family)
MKKLLVIALVSIFAAIPMLGFGQTLTVSADDGDHTAESSNEQQEASSYTYEAQEYDTYTELARKAIQTYGLETETNLSGAQIVFAETKLTQEAGSILLNKGQSVSIEKSTVQKWVEEAQKLSEADQKAWDFYAQFVDFDTSDNGESA